MMMYKYIYFCFILSLCLGSCQQSSTSKQSTLNNISVQVVNAIQKTSNSPYTIIDVRTPDEYADGHIDQALNIDVKSDQFADEVKKLNPSKKYILYCRSGKRSSKAYGIMTDLNFENLYNMEGGYLKYKDEILNN